MYVRPVSIITLKYLNLHTEKKLILFNTLLLM